LALSTVIGVIAGWLIWGGRSDSGADADEVRRLQAELDRANAKNRAATFDLEDDTPPMPDVVYSRPIPRPIAEPARVEPISTPRTKAGTKPAGLDAARDGLPDDLTTIKGIGPKMEKLCNHLGFWHFDQIAGWTAAEVAWVDGNLEGFKGRVTRDNWVEQAKTLSGK
jgi:predicted flap endonuclease-1-like 5' DNA nuclease